MSASAVRPKRPASSSSTGSPAAKSKNDGVSDESSNPETVARTLAGFNGNRRVPPPVNEPVKSYAPGSPERAALKDRLRSMSDERADIPLIIGGQEVHSKISLFRLKRRVTCSPFLMIWCKFTQFGSVPASFSRNQAWSTAKIRKRIRNCTLMSGFTECHPPTKWLSTMRNKPREKWKSFALTTEGNFQNFQIGFQNFIRLGYDVFGFCFQSSISVCRLIHESRRISQNV